MDGIFGVGIAEIIIIGLVILIIGGPKNAARWANELGKMVRKGRELWSQMMKELEKDVGDEGREIMDAARQLRREVDDIRGVANPRKLVSQAGKVIDDTKKEAASMVRQPLKETERTIKKATTGNGKYNAWTKPDTDTIATDEQPPQKKYSAWLPSESDGDEPDA